jgi:hypothetical protein
MKFSEWKKRSKIFNAFKGRSENYGIGLDRCCAAAYKAGERSGMDNAEAMAKAAIFLREEIRAKYGENQ